MRWLLLAIGFSGIGLGCYAAHDRDQTDASVPADQETQDTPSDTHVFIRPCPESTARIRTSSSLTGSEPHRFSIEQPLSSEWILDLGVSAHTTAPVVDSNGRIYVTVDTVDGDGLVLSDTLVVLSPDGHEEWRYSEGRTMSRSAALLCGDLVIVKVQIGAAESEVVVLSAAGAVVNRRRLPEGLSSWPPVVLPDGGWALTMGHADNEQGSMWVLDPIGVERRGVERRRVLLPGPARGLPVVSGDRIVIVYRDETGDAIWVGDVAGRLHWEASLSGRLVGGPIFSRDGSIVVSVGHVSRQEVQVYDSDGALSMNAEFDIEPPTTRRPMAISENDGGVFVRTYRSIIALERTSGRLRWMRAVHPNSPYGLIVDAEGHLILTAGRLFVLDPQTGEPVWDVAADGMFSLQAAALVGDDRLLAATSDGRFHLFGVGE